MLIYIRKNINLLFYILLISALFFSFNVKSKTKDTLRLIDLFSKVLEKTHEDYVEEISEQELIEKAINGMLTALDPHSSYMNEDTFKEMQTDISGKFGGLGIHITMDEGFVKIISPIDDTPAFNAGLKAGDLITQINSSPVLGLTLKEAVDLMRGRPGSKITITIAREGTEIFDVVLVREIIKIKSVKHTIYNNVGYLRISSFTEETKNELYKEIKKAKNSLNKNDIGYILDLRSNPGGLLKSAIAVADAFLNKGEIVSTKERNNKNVKKYRAKNGDLIDNKPLIVLINGGSASASEIVAGALQDHKRAIILGTKSFGKGSVQSIIPLMDYNRKKQGAIRLTTARYYTPSGKSIQAKGIEPDIVVEQGKFESDNFEMYSESDLLGSLDKEIKNENSEIFNEKNNLKNKDYQLSRALDLIKVLSITNLNSEN